MQITYESLDVLHRKLLEEHAFKQCNSIFEFRDQNNDTRTYDEILASCVIYSIPEYYLMQCGYMRCDHKYCDLYDAKGSIIEVKTCKPLKTQREYYVTCVSKINTLFTFEREYSQRKNINNFKVFDYLYLFSMTSDYKFTLEIVVNRNKEILDINHNKLQGIDWYDEITQ